MAYTERARTAPRRIRIRKTRVVALLCLVAVMAALVLERHTPSGSLGTVDGAASTGRLALGQAGGLVPDGTSVFDDAIPGVGKLNADLLRAVRRAATDAADEGVQFSVDSGWRSPQYQGRLLSEAISKYGSEAEANRWVATPNTSAHVKGEAIDVGPPGAATWLSEHGAAYGLCQIYANEPWHYELRPNAAANGCPAAYPDPTHDPRMRR